MSSATATIARHEENGRGRYWVELAPGEEAELTYRRTAPDIVVVDHTGTPPRFRGQGTALTLVEAIVADARAEGFRIAPLCPYVDVQFRRHPEWADLREG